MAMFVHLTPEKAVRAIVRVGIKPGKGRPGVYCLPVLPSYEISHQWLRELRRSGQRTLVAVNFRIPDDERVTVGHYGRVPVEMTAAEAVAVVMSQQDPRGYEVVVPRTITKGEVHRVRHVNQVSGWRYEPDAHGKPLCACVVCVRRGTFKAADIVARLGDPPRPTKPELMADLADAFDDGDTYGICSALRSLGWRSRGDAGDLAFLLDHEATEVRVSLATALHSYRGREAADMLRRLAADPSPRVRQAATKKRQINST